ncbi:MAG: ChbG/HpnK family deacetylase [bacterium]|nr:ChbG/HpnK family deacetylase [bacterium]
MAGTTTPTYAERLGWPRDARAVIFNVDDAGMCDAANRGAIEAVTKGVATSTSVMMPGPWACGFAADAADQDIPDVGVHITLNSEWTAYRWGPVAGRDAVPSLLDPDGYLWPDVESLAGHAKAEDVATEIRAQVDAALTLGISPTHLDTHMWTAFAEPEFFQAYLQVALEHGIPPLVPGGHMRHIEGFVGAFTETARMMAEAVWHQGLPAVDDLHIVSDRWTDPALKKRNLIQFLGELEPGITHFVSHCTAPNGDFRDIADCAPSREADLALMLDPEIRDTLKREGIITVSWRELKTRRDAVG